MTKKKPTSSSPSGAAAVELLCSTIAEAMLDKKAQRVLSLDLSQIESAIATAFVLCNADSTTQIEAIADNVEEHVRKVLGEKPVRREGFGNSIWIILDYVDVMVHIFQTEARNFYRLEALWADAKQRSYDEERQASAKKEEKTSSKALATEKTPTKKAAAPKVAVAKKPKAAAAKASTAKKATPVTPKITSAKITKPAAKKTESAVKKTASAAKKTESAAKKTASAAKKAVAAKINKS